MRAAAIAITASLLVACGGGANLGGDRLDEEDCALLMDQIHEIFGKSLRGEERATYDGDRDREADIAECVEEQNWDRDGLECALEATNEAGLRRCIMGL